MKYDLIVIGGGPSGMMAAGRAGELGARVLLLEKNSKLGNKLLITGKGRCNISNTIKDTRKIVKQFGENGKFLFSALNVFSTEDTVSFFESLGLATKEERGGRIFPENDSAEEVLDSLLKYLEKGKVEVRTNIIVKDFLLEEKKISRLLTFSGEEIVADNYLIATGGKSYPGTGSTGDGYIWAEKMGHKIVNPVPSLTPIILKEPYIKELEGLSLKNVQISLMKDKKKLDSQFGEAIFTEDGMSGPVIMDLSKNVSLYQNADLKILIDFKPVLDFSDLDKRILKDFQENNNKIFKNSLDGLLPQKLIPIIVKLSGIKEDKKVNLVSRDERKRLVHLLKEFTLEVRGVRGFPKAIVTSGGISLGEVDPKTMKSKIVPNLYFVGEVLDLDGPTGGYNLQVCWSTGFCAGNNFKINK